MELYFALHKIFEQFGKDLIAEERIINFLSDYQAFDIKASRRVMKTLIQMEFGKKIIEADKFDFAERTIIMNNISNKLEQEGFKKRLVDYVLGCIGYGLGWSDTPSSEEAVMDWLSKEEVVNIDGQIINMIKVNGGTFAMGATPEQGLNSRFDERPSVVVSVSDFFIAETVVTQMLWESIMGMNYSHFKSPNLPVERVTWYECEEFLKRLSLRSGIKFRLPTEAEWEFAARGGSISTNKKYAGTDDDSIADYLWYKDNSGMQSHDVKTKKPNEVGLYDMCGNVAEWCSDWYFNSYAYSGVMVDPKGPVDGIAKVYRGGSYADIALNCRVSKRFFMNPNYKSKLVGFRIAVTTL